MLHWHGSRGPQSEHDFILGLVKTLDRAHDTIQNITLPPNLQFRYEYQLVLEELTPIRRQELFNHGAEYALRYPAFSTSVVLSSPVRRVVDSAYFFAQGFFGREAENVTFRTVADLDDPVSWITPWKSCPRFPDDESHQLASQWADKYAPPIAHRLGKLIPGANISVNDTRGALYACPFDLAARNQSPWCGVFSTKELQNLEYEYDLLMDNLSSHVSRGDPGPLLGAFYVKKLIERDPLPLYPHHTTVPRRFRTSHQAPFAASMTWERFTCKTSFKGPQIRLVLNGATFPLFICKTSFKGQGVWNMFTGRIYQGE